MRILGVLIAAQTACPAGPSTATESVRPRSMLELDDTNVRSSFYYEIFARLRSTLTADTGPAATIYAERLHLARFNGQAYEEDLQQYFSAKYEGRPIGVIVSIGSAALDYVLRWWRTLWPAIPVVFGFVDAPTIAGLTLPPDVTGSIVKFRFADMMPTARAVVPDLQRIAFVGDPLETQTVYRHWKSDIPGATVGLQIIDLQGLRLPNVRQRFASLRLEGGRFVYLAEYEPHGSGHGR
jgi:hypothetical protein